MTIRVPTASPPPSTLATFLWPPASDVRAALWRAILLALVGSALLTVSAKVQVPFWPVPMTMQTLVVLIVGAACGWRLGAATVLLYLAIGATGLPVFAGTPQRGAGVAYMLGPTGGFLIGFLVSAMVTGALAERGWGRRVIGIVALGAVGHVVIFAFGAGWLAARIGWPRAWAAGVQPFIPGAILKTALAAALLQAGWVLVARKRVTAGAR